MRQQSMIRQNYEQMLSDLSTFTFGDNKLPLHEKVLQIYKLKYPQFHIKLYINQEDKHLLINKLLDDLPDCEFTE